MTLKMNKIEDKIDIYKIEDKNEMLLYYKKWSKQYNKDMVDWNYVAPLKATKLLSKYVKNKDANILDAGCGTGLVGIILNHMGYYNICGLDFSKSMISLVPKKIYKKLFISNLNNKLKFSSKKFDAIICVGTFTYGHVKDNAMSEISKKIKKGGYFCFTINEGVYKKYNFNKTIKKLEYQNLWKIIEKSFDDYIIAKRVKSWNFIVKIL